jgi:K+-sensing histidine kinase KdpD
LNNRELLSTVYIKLQYSSSSHYSRNALYSWSEGEKINWNTLVNVWNRNLNIPLTILLIFLYAKMLNHMNAENGVELILLFLFSIIVFDFVFAYIMTTNTLYIDSLLYNYILYFNATVISRYNDFYL